MFDEPHISEELPGALTFLACQLFYLSLLGG